MKSQNQTTASKVRLSVSVPSMDYSELEIIASKQKVSVAWVIRDAIDNYLNSRANLASNRMSNTKKKK
jgi:metal-responsive CopG/Arc/MetJ family transcriptional regulator